MEDNKEQEINQKEGKILLKIPDPFIKNGRVIEYSEKAISDHIQLFSRFKSKANLLEQLHNEFFIENIDSVSFIKGQKITIEATVQDSVLSSLVFNAMYGKSESDGKALWLAGIEIHCISFEGATHFDENELSVIMAATEILKNKLNPNNDGQQ